MKPEELRQIGQNIRLIVCDLDGTLLNSEKQIGTATLSAIEAARNKGVLTTICSGRIPSMMEAYVRTLNLSIPIITSNGAVIVQADTGAVLYKNPALGCAVLPLLDFCAANGFDYSVLSSEGGFFSKNSVRVKRFIQYNDIAKSQGLPEIPMQFFDGDHSIAMGGDIYKLLIYELKPGDGARAEAFLQTCNLAYTSSERGLLDVSAPGVNKGEGVKRLTELMGLAREHICVFGDYLNDIPMMEAAALPIAMGNANDEVKRSALAVTASCDDDGIARAIEAYIL